MGLPEVIELFFVDVYCALAVRPISDGRGWLGSRPRWACGLGGRRLPKPALRESENVIDEQERVGCLRRPEVFRSTVRPLRATRRRRLALGHLAVNQEAFDSTGRPA